MLSRHTVTLFVSIALSSLPLPGQAKDAKDAKGAKPDVQAELVALQKEIVKADKDNAKIAALVTAFADQHRPEKTPVAVLLSTDKKLCVAIGANGTEKKPEGAAVEFEPAGTAFNVAVGGKGFDSKTDAGGTGGTVVLKAAGKGTTILVGGAGGKGADSADGKQNGKKGGGGGGVWFGTFTRKGDVFVGGAGGTGGNPGGSGGNAGNAGPGPGR